MKYKTIFCTVLVALTSLVSAQPQQQQGQLDPHLQQLQHQQQQALQQQAQQTQQQHQQESGGWGEVSEKYPCGSATLNINPEQLPKAGAVPTNGGGYAGGNMGGGIGYPAIGSVINVNEYGLGNSDLQCDVEVPLISCSSPQFKEKKSCVANWGKVEDDMTKTKHLFNSTCSGCGLTFKVYGIMTMSGPYVQDDGMVENFYDVDMLTVDQLTKIAGACNLPDLTASKVIGLGWKNGNLFNEDSCTLDGNLMTTPDTSTCTEVNSGSGMVELRTFIEEEKTLPVKTDEVPRSGLLTSRLKIPKDWNGITGLVSASEYWTLSREDLENVAVKLGATTKPTDMNRKITSLVFTEEPIGDLDTLFNKNLTERYTPLKKGEAPRARILSSDCGKYRTVLNEEVDWIIRLSYPEKKSGAMVTRDYSWQCENNKNPLSAGIRDVPKDFNYAVRLKEIKN